MNKYQQKHIITLSRRQKRQLHDITRKGKHNARVIRRAKILLKSDAGWKDEKIAQVVEVNIRTVGRVRTRFADGGLDRALSDAPRPGQPPKLNDTTEAHLVALACSEPPEGAHHWTLKLLQERLITDKKVDTISTVAIWKHLNQRGVKPWREKNVVRTKD